MTAPKTREQTEAAERAKALAEARRIVVQEIGNCERGRKPQSPPAWLVRLDFLLAAVEVSPPPANEAKAPTKRKRETRLEETIQAVARDMREWLGDDNAQPVLSWLDMLVGALLGPEGWGGEPEDPPANECCARMRQRAADLVALTAGRWRERVEQAEVHSDYSTYGQDATVAAMLEQMAEELRSLPLSDRGTGT